jgi:hypothetical protein
MPRKAKTRARKPNNNYASAVGRQEPAIVTIIRVGCRERPASQVDLDDVKAELRSAFQEKRPPVLHDLVDSIQFEPCHAMVRVGDRDRPASREDLAGVARSMREAIRRTARGESACVVTHHAVDVIHLPELDPASVMVLGHEEPQKEPTKKRPAPKARAKTRAGTKAGTKPKSRATPTNFADTSLGCTSLSPARVRNRRAKPRAR